MDTTSICIDICIQKLKIKILIRFGNIQPNIFFKRLLPSEFFNGAILLLLSFIAYCFPFSSFSLKKLKIEIYFRLYYITHPYKYLGTILHIHSTCKW